MHRSTNGPTNSLVLTCFRAGCVALLVLSGCERPPAAASKAPLGAADIKELVERYEQAHRAKDIESFEPFTSSCGSATPDLGETA